MSEESLYITLDLDTMVLEYSLELVFIVKGLNVIRAANRFALQEDVGYRAAARESNEDLLDHISISFMRMLIKSTLNNEKSDRRRRSSSTILGDGDNI
jgi:hypothetical protein